MQVKTESTEESKDPVWEDFTEVETKDKKGIKAKCKVCNTAMVALVARMKGHLEKCAGKGGSLASVAIKDDEASTSDTAMDGE